MAQLLGDICTAIVVLLLVIIVIAIYSAFVYGIICLLMMCGLNVELSGAFAILIAMVMALSLIIYIIDVS